jgi:hypothetical protein
MTKAFAILAACLALASPLSAEMLTGTDDPAYQTALTTLLARNDPAAVAALRDLAEAGNTAALVMLPLALQWVPPQGNLKEKNAQRTVGGVKALDAAKAAHPATALWDNGQIDDSMALPNRAAGLLNLGEPEKAAVLLGAWLNQTGGVADLPPQLLSEEIPATIGAIALGDRLRRAVYEDGPVQAEAARLLTLMRQDRLVGWLTYVQLLDAEPEILDHIGNPVAGTGLSATDTDKRVEDARAVRIVWRASFGGNDAPTPAATATRARDVLAGTVTLLPLTRLCQTRCPDSIATCEAAVLLYPGLVNLGYAGAQPFADVLDPIAFAGSDRGLQVLNRAPDAPITRANRTTAEALDACYAGVLDRRDQISFAP